MSYLDIYPWAPGSQLLPGLDILDVQLPGCELLLPLADGNFVEPTTTSIQKTKHHPDSNYVYDLEFENDWINSRVDGDFFGDDSGHDPDELLPSSPEATSCDLNTADFIHVSGHATTDKKADVLPVILGSTPDVHPTSVAVLDIDCTGHNTDGNIFDEDGFDPNWLLSSEPILPRMFVEEVESLLSASPSLDSIFSEENWDISGAEFEASEIESGHSVVETTFDGSPLENLQVLPDPVILFAPSPMQDNVGLISTSPVHVHQNGINWLDTKVVGRSLLGGLMPDRTLVMTTITGSVPNLGISSAESPATLSESESSAGPITNKSTHSLARTEPYPTCGTKPERQERKKEQNKTAALKYRLKKREAQGVFVSECEQLEQRNVELKSRVEELTREINYLKGLFSEIYSSE